MKRIALGRHIVRDPRICHGKLTFRGTRIFVSSVLAAVAKGMDWDAIIKQWHGSISKPAISEAVRLANEALLDRVGETPGDIVHG